MHGGTMAETSIVIRETGLKRLDQATKALAEASTLSEIKDIRDKAEVIRIYAKTSGAGLDIQNGGAELKLRAERKGGKICLEVEREQGKRTDLTSYQADSKLEALVKEADVPMPTILRWQQEAKVPDKEFEDHIEQITSESKELTSAGLRRLARLYQPKPEPKSLPDDKYKVIYADPPWQYADKLVEGYGTVEHHYPSMSIEEICAMKVKDIVLPDAVLFLWVTSPMLDKCWLVIKAWGFEYKASFVWDKIQHNYGHYNSVRHEFLLLCTRGSCLPETKKLNDSVISIRRSKKHSEKPPEFRKMIDRMYPTSKRIELFATIKVKEWDSYGMDVS